MGFTLFIILFCAVDFVTLVSVTTSTHITNKTNIDIAAGALFSEGGIIIPDSPKSLFAVKSNSTTLSNVNVTTPSKEILKNPSSPVPVSQNNTIQEPPLSKTSNNFTSTSSSVSPSNLTSKPFSKVSNSSTTTTTTTTTTTSTTTTTTRKPIPKKPLIAKAAIEVFPESVLKRKLNKTSTSSTTTMSSMNIVNATRVVTQESDKVPPPVVEESVEKDPVSRSPPQIVKYSGFSNSGPSFIVPLVITIFAMPILGFLTYHAFKKGREAWQNRHYHRMDFLIDGMYND